MAPSLSPTGFWCNAPPSGSHRRPGRVVTVMRLGRATPLPLEHPSRDHLQGGRLPIPLRRVGRHDDRARTHRVLSGGASPALGCGAPLRSRGLSSPEVPHVAIGHGEAAHVSLAPGPEPCSLIAAVAPRRLPRDVTCPVADSGRYLMDYAAMSVGNTAEEDAAGGLLSQTVAGLIEKLVARGSERGYVTYDELSATLPLNQLSSEEIEDTLTMLSELGITVTESDESEEPVAPEGEPAKADGSLDHDDTGRTDDPVRMYLREMSSIRRLSREGEVAIAKRIEAGRETMLGAIRESPLTFDAILGWRDALDEGKMLLRDIIDFDATSGGGFDCAVVFTPG